MQINPKNHLSCSPQHDHVYGYSDKRKNSKLNTEAVKKAIKLLFEEVTPEQEKDLVRIARKEFAEHMCVVWVKIDYYKESEFYKFLERNSLDIGEKEVIILDDGESVQYTDSFYYKPRLVE